MSGTPPPLFRRETLTREILRLSVPALLQSLLQTTQFVIDTKMVAEYGGDDPAPLAAMAVVGPLCWSLTVIFTITSVGATAVISRRIGEGRQDQATVALCTSLTLATIGGFVVLALGWPLREPVIQFFGQVFSETATMAVFEAAEAYLFWFILLFPLRALLVTLESSLRGAGESLLPFWGGVISNIANVGGNAILIFGLLGAPAMGVEGAGLATALAPVAELIFLIAVLTWVRQPRLAWSFRWRAHFDRSVARELIRISGPALGGALIFHSGFLLYQVAIFDLSAELIAAHRVSITLQSLGFLPAAGFYFSAASLAGRSLGAGDRELALLGAWRNVRWSLFFALPISAVFLVAAEPLARFFTDIPETVAAAAICLQIGAIEIPFLVITESLNGTLRGAGATRAPMLITAVGTWGIRVPFSWILAHHVGWGLTGIWVATVFDWLVRGILTWWAVRRGRWLDSVA